MVITTFHVLIIACFESSRILIALAAQECWSLHHLDVKSAFLNCAIKEEIFVSPLEGYVKEGKEEWVLDETRPRGRRFHTVSCQKLFRTYQFWELRVN